LLSRALGKQDNANAEGLRIEAPGLDVFPLHWGRVCEETLPLSTKISDICLQMACFTAILHDRYEEAFDSDKAEQLAFLKTSWRETGQNSPNRDFLPQAGRVTISQYRQHSSLAYLFAVTTHDRLSTILATIQIYLKLPNGLISVSTCQPNMVRLSQQYADAAET